MSDSASLEAASPEVSTVEVALGERRYEIRVGAGLMAAAGALIARELAPGKAVIVTDRHVAPLHLAPVAGGLARHGIATAEIVLAAGESSKSLAGLGDLLHHLLAAGIDRRTVVVALGGGVVGDLAGFAAAIALRGLRFVQIPTTLLSQVDSSVGGKTAINMPQGKNLVGSFHQPSLVLADIAALDSLPRRELLAGYAELVKHALIRDAGFFNWLERHGPALIEGDHDARRLAVARSCAIKAAIVAADEREAGERALLNFGHTFAHAFEAAAGYDDRLRHGEAVAIGMVKALRLSVLLGHCPGQDAARAVRHFARLGLPTALRQVAGAGDWQPADLVARMGGDKKAQAGRPRFVLSRAIGDAFIREAVPPETVMDVLREDAAQGAAPA